MRRIFASCAASSLIFALMACSSGGGSSGMQTVQAQSGYSNSSLSGTYSLTWWNFYSVLNGISYYSAVGAITLNGAGAITGGTITTYNHTTVCPYTVSGTYNLQSTALGTATLNLISTTNGCTADSWQLALAAAGGGTTIQMARTDQVANGSATKQ